MESTPLVRFDRRRTGVLLAVAAVAAVPFAVAAANQPERHRACGTVSARAYVGEDATSFDLNPWTEEFRRAFALPDVQEAVLRAVGAAPGDIDLRLADPVPGESAVEVCATAATGTAATVAVVEAGTGAVVRLATEQVDRARLVERERLRQLEEIPVEDQLRRPVAEALLADAVRDRLQTETRLRALDGAAALTVQEVGPIDRRPATVRAGLAGAGGAAAAIAGVYVTVDASRRRGSDRR